ncbi:Putative Rad2-like endonuclease [Aspergillus calidoustus]|uniref:Putative Rad2-like endonuclease n=1 Tax=Aspergillus calidoustus TaxID=454130 RepID=A0A0U5G7I1_ASPCI|nr:Putative Rad2-like endonuclease [Aspergillus calidoustus]
MGIPGLINALGPGERISLSKLAITHLERTSRPIRIAVDISIWLFQVQAGRGGKNPELRTLFYRLLKILALPIHPLFVYDGKDKPPFKRGKAVSGRSYGSAPIIQLSKILIDLFKFPRHEAPGEAEAECARLQMAGVVDAVMSNDVDTLMFGSRSTIMNFSKEGGSGSAAATHVTCYTMNGDDSSNVKLDRPGMILFAMLSGGDYLPSGVPKCGSKLAAEIAKAGFGGDLLEALEADDLDAKLSEWRERLQYELEENESGYFQTKHKVVRIPEAFPDRTILSYYAKPVVSSEQDIELLRYRLRNAWDREVDVFELRQFTADTLDWKYRSGARKVIRLLAEPLVSYRLRLGKHGLVSGRPRLSHDNAPVLHKIYKSRTSFSTDGLTELQLDMVPIDIVGLDLLAEEPNPPLPLPSQETAASGDEGEDGEGEAEAEAEMIPQSPTKKRVTKRYDPYATEKVWVFEALASIGIPQALETWKKEQAAKQNPPPKKTTTRKGVPRRRKELDPSMKQGSILKYGTLKKGRSDMSEYKSAQLFEAAVSSTPPSRSPPFSSPGVHGLTTTPPNLNRADGFDYLVDRFASCNLTGSPVKRRPVTRTRAAQRTVIGSDGAERIEIADEDSDDLSIEMPSLRMSYSNASYKELHCHEFFSQPYKNPRASPRPSQRRKSEMVEDLEYAISSLQLNSNEEDMKIARNSPRKSPKKRVEKKSESVLIERLGSTTHDHTTLKLSEVETIPKQSEPKNKEAALPVTEPSGDPNCQATETRNVPTHLESITVYNGYWAIEPETKEEKDVKTVKKSKTKRLPRVSILDLTTG